MWWWNKEPKDTIFIPSAAADTNRYDTIWTCAAICSQFKIRKIVMGEIKPKPFILYSKNNWVITSSNVTPADFAAWKNGGPVSMLKRRLNCYHDCKGLGAAQPGGCSLLSDLCTRLSRLQCFRKTSTVFDLLCKTAGSYDHGLTYAHKHLQLIVDLMLTEAFERDPLKVAKSLAEFFTAHTQRFQPMELAICDIEDISYRKSIKLANTAKDDKRQTQLLCCPRLIDYTDEVALQAALQYAETENVRNKDVRIEFVLITIRTGGDIRRMLYPVSTSQPYDISELAGLPFVLATRPMQGCVLWEYSTPIELLAQALSLVKPLTSAKSQSQV